jgi:hypothetical protein
MHPMAQQQPQQQYFLLHFGILFMVTIGIVIDDYIIIRFSFVKIKRINQIQFLYSISVEANKAPTSC